MSRILVIGGYGGFGGRLSRRLVEAGHQVIVGGRDAGKAESFCRNLPGSAPARIDRNGQIGNDLARLAPELVIDAAGPFQGSGYSVPEACIRARISYLDLADSREFVGGIEGLDEAARAAGVAVISGASTLPALSGAVIRKLADGLDRVDQVVVSLTASTKSTANSSVIEAILSYAGKPLSLVRGGRVTKACGWQEMRRETFEVTGRGRLRRWVALADVPDLDIVPASLPGQPSVEFRAGTDVSIHMIGLWLGSWLVRLRILDSLRPFAAPVRALQRATTFARGDRSAMRVMVKGRRGPAGIERRWTVVAENFDGPEIPTLAAALLADDFATGGLPEGARDASRSLTLGRFEPLFAKLDVRHESTERAIRPLYERAMGQRFDALPEAIRGMHRIYGDGGASGRGRVATGAGPLGWIIRQVMGFPPAGEYPLHVTFTERDGKETWVREFGAYCFRSHLSLQRGRLTERFGPLAFTFELPSDNCGLRMLLQGWSAFGVPFPRWLAPRIAATETEQDGRFKFRVSVALPLIGPVVAYEGLLDRL